jgi:predicted dehydrogenase
MKKVIWGILSTAKIGVVKVIPAMQKSPWIEVRAIASRSLAVAQNAARELQIPIAYGSYEELLADPEIEAVYNPLPNHLHVPLTLRAAAAGKHVLCEKPIALSADDAVQLRLAADKVHIMEAFMIRFHPQWQRARDLVRSGKIGELRAVQVFFSYYNDDPANIRNQFDIGGGAVYDIGCYGVVSGRFLFEADPRRVVALIDRDPTFRTDRTASVLMDFGQGRQLSFTASTQCVLYQRVQICGTRGRIEIQIPFNAPRGEETRIFTDDGTALDGRNTVSEVLEPCDQYTLEAESFSRAVRGEIPLPYGVDDAVMNMRITDAIFRSEKTGCFEDV